MPPNAFFAKNRHFCHYTTLGVCLIQPNRCQTQMKLHPNEIVGLIL